jgi:phage gp29-like protein
MASQLILGQNGGGSFSLAESLNGISQMAVEARLIEIKDILNQDLVPQLFALNGWQTDVLPEITYGDLSTPDLDVLSKFIQRCASVGLVGQDAATVNWIASQANMPIPFEDASIDIEEARQMLTGYSSGAGEGMAKGSGNGTSDSASGTDNSAANMENS